MVEANSGPPQIFGKFKVAVNPLWYSLSILVVISVPSWNAFFYYYLIFLKTWSFGQKESLVDVRTCHGLHLLWSRLIFTGKSADAFLPLAPIGSTPKLIARHPLQLELASKREVRFPFQRMTVSKFNFQLLGTTFALNYRGVALL